MEKVVDMKIEAVNAASKKLTPSEVTALKPQVKGWAVIQRGGEKRLERVYKFKDFAEALAFTVKIGKLADKVNHHPALLTEWGKVTVGWWTHKIKGLHRNDFIMAARTDALYGGS